jgi:glycosyltransferase involved in cell wall biosynthesis
MQKSRIRVLVVGQTPPPFHGQAVAVQKMLEGNYRNVIMYHVRMGFSDTIGELGKFKWKKIIHLLVVIIAIIYKRFRYNIQVLYYIPAGPNRLPLYRDLITLIMVRYVFKYTVFHFHSTGLSEQYQSLAPILKPFYRRAYYYPDLGIHLSECIPQEGIKLKSKHNVIVPNGIEDSFQNGGIIEKSIEKDLLDKEEVATILFVGNIKISKGILVLLEAANVLRHKGVAFKIKVIGGFKLDSEKAGVIQFIQDHQLNEYVEFLGELTGGGKWMFYRSADIFCFPSYFESEGMPLVILEAMQFGLPVVATNWRGIPSQVQDNVSGFLVPIKDYAMVAEKLNALIQDGKLRRAMGDEGRRIYLEKFTIEKYWNNIENAILHLARLQ